MGYRQKYTVVGYGALLFWSMSATLTAMVSKIPTFQIISIALAISFLLACIMLTIGKRWHTIKQPYMVWIVGIIGINCNDMLYIAASKHAPVVQVGLICYLWPIFVVLFSSFMPREKITLGQGIAVIVGFIAVYILTVFDNELGYLSMAYLPGYILAVSGSIIWSIFILNSRQYPKSPPEIIGIFCGVGMCVSLCLHLSLETFVVPDTSEWVAMILMGLFTQGSAYLLWDLGIKRGNFKLLTILSYGNPILSVAWLILSGHAKVTPALLVACLLVVISGLITKLEVLSWQRIREYCSKSAALNN